MLTVNKSLVDRLGFDLATAVADYTAALEAHKLSIGVPAPSAVDIVEIIVKHHGGEFTIFDDTVQQNPDTEVKVTTMQARLALEDAGLLDVIDAYVETLGKRASTKWHYSSFIYRSDPLFDTVISSGTLTSQQIDDLFIAASQEV